MRAVAADERASVDQGTVGAELAASLEHYGAQSQYYAANADEANRYTRLRTQAAELAARTFEGVGTCRELAIGTWFTLSAHPRHATDNEFVVLAAEHKIENNLPREGRAAALAFSNRFECAPRGIPLRLPGAGAPGSKPTAPGIQSATVVGPQKAVRHTDALGRIRIRYHWPRAAEHPNGGAALDERASQWVRVASMAAGAGFGMIDIPRVGDEVLVMFDGGDIDRPVVVGSLANGKHAPPAFSGASGLPANQALSGWKTNAFDGAGYNELVFDDTAGELRARLATEQSKSQLNLGYLTHPRKEGTAEPRGEGAELRSDASVAIRGAHGVLLSAAAQPGAAGGQLAREEIIRQLQAALELAQGLGRYAAAHAGKAPDSTTQKALAQAVTHWHQGTNVAKNGDGASGQRAGRAPIVLASGPAGIGMTTPEGMTLHAGKHVDLIAEQNAQIAAAANVVVNAGDAVSVFAHKGGIQQIAHQGKLTLQAQHDAIDIVADKSVRVVSGAEHVAISADKHITLTCGGAYIRLQGGNIEIGGPGRFVVKTKSHSFERPASMAGETPAFDRGEMDRRVQLVRRGDGGFLPDTRYRVTRADGSVVEGVSDAQGRTSIAQSDHFERLNIEILGKGGA